MFRALQYWQLSVGFAIVPLLLVGILFLLSWLRFDTEASFMNVIIATTPGFLLGALFFGTKAFREKGVKSSRPKIAAGVFILSIVILLFLLVAIWYTLQMIGGG